MSLLDGLKRLRFHDHAIGAAVADMRAATAERQRAAEELRQALAKPEAEPEPESRPEPKLNGHAR